MGRETYIYRPNHPEANANGFIPKWMLGEVRTEAHFVHADGMNKTWHPANGKHYESKSEFRRVTREHGCVEMGNDQQTQARMGQSVTKSDVAKAYQMVSQGYRPNVLSEKL